MPLTGAAAAVDLDDDADLEGALADWRSFRSRKRLADVHWVDTLYQAYLAGILCVVAVFGGATIVGDEPVATTDALARDGEALLGLVVAVIVAIGLRSGSRGGPLALDRPDVRHVLLSPVDRVRALRGPALKQLRFVLFAAALAGATAGHLADRRLDGSGVAWTACGALAAFTAAGLAHGLACCTAGLRVRPWLASLVGLLLVGASVAHVADRLAWAPGAAVGGIALWPIRFEALELLAVAGAVAVVVAGLRAVGGVSMEQLERRSRLVGQMRFAATMQDLRTVVVLRRQLTQERARTRPWLRPTLPRRAAPVFVRDLRSLLRWPIGRLTRLLVLAAVAGITARSAFEGTTPLIVVAGLALFIAGLDAAEPLGQDLDHPTRRDTVPVPSGSIHARHLPAVVIVSMVVAAAAAVVGVLVDPTAGAWSLALACVPAAGLGAACGAVVNMLMGVTSPAGTASSAWNLAPPEAAGVRLVYRTVWPPAITTLGASVVIAAREVMADGGSGVQVALAGAAAMAAITSLVSMWARYRDAAKTWWAAQIDANAGRTAGDVVIEATGLAKDYGDLVALAPLDLVVPDGEAVALVGHNGSGKSTFLKLASGLLDPSDGTVVIAGHAAGTPDARAATSYVPDEPVLYDDLSVAEHLRYIAALHGADVSDEMIAELVERLGLADRVDDLPARFSRGLRQKAGLAVALIRPFSLLLVDEPFVGLDAPGRAALLELLDEAHAAGATLVVATHDPTYVERVDRCVALRNGAVVHDGPATPDEVLRLVGA